MQLPVQKQILYWGGALAVLLLALWGLGNAVTPFIMGAAVAISSTRWPTGSSG